MASARKSTPEKRTPATGNKKKSNSSMNKASNGAAAPSSSSWFEISQTPKSNGKRELEEESANKFPMERVKRIARSEDKEMKIAHDAVFVVNKATEKFLERFCGEAYDCCVQDRKKSLMYKASIFPFLVSATAVSKWDRYEFLSDFVPVKVKAKDALAEIKTMDPETAS